MTTTATSVVVRLRGNALKELTRTREEVQAIIIVVPGPGTLDADRWDKDIPWSWLLDLGPSTERHVAVYEFETALYEDNILYWDRIEEEGARLLRDLQQLTSSDQLIGRPIVFVAHSLGGLLLKRAVGLAYHQQRNQQLLGSLAAAILLSCPHSQSDDGIFWRNVGLLPRACASRPKHAIPAPLKEALNSDFRRFEHAFKDLSVLSLYETSGTRMAPWHKEVLIPQAFARTNVAGEILKGVALDHRNICCLRNQQRVLTQIEGFVEEAVQKSQRIIAERRQAYERPHAPEIYTARSRSNTAQSAHARSPWANERSDDLESSSSGPTPPDARREIGEALLPPAPSRDQHPSLSDSSLPSGGPHLPCFVMPHDRSLDFNGRSDALSEMGTTMMRTDASGRQRPRGQGVTTFALCGAGGIGKTQVAIEFVHKHNADFDVVLWIPAEGREKIAQAFTRIAVALGLVFEDSIESMDKVLTRDIVIRWLERPIKSYKHRELEQTEDATWLIVFDNVKDPHVLEDFWPRNTSGSVVTTSRDPLAVTSFYSATSVFTLKPFDETESASNLLKITRREDDSEDRALANKVAKAVRGLPLAIVQTAGAIARKDISFAEFLEQYQDPRSRDDVSRHTIGNQIAQGYEHTIASVWGFDALTHSVDTMDVLSFLDPDGIPEYIFQGNRSRTDMTSLPQSDMDYEAVRTELLQSSLVTRNRKDKRLFVHRLAQDAVRANMTDERYSTVFTATLQLLSAVWPHEQAGFIQKYQSNRWPRCNDLYPHMLRLCKLSKRVQPPTQLTEARVEPPKVLLGAAWYSILKSDFEDTLPFIELAEFMIKPLQKDTEGFQRLPETVQDDFREQLRLTYFHKGCLGLHNNNPAMSLPNHKAFITDLKSNLNDGSHDNRIGLANNELGNAYLQNSLTSEAEECYRRAVELMKAPGTASAHDISMTLINLGFAVSMQGRLEEAASVFQEALDKREAAFGKDDTRNFAIGKLLLGYGNVRALQGQQDESFRLHKRSLRQYRVVVGPFHHRTGDACVHVADHYFRLRDYQEAKKLLDQAARIYKDRTCFRPEMARVSYKQWKVQMLLNEEPGHRVIGEDVLRMYRELVPSDHRPLKDLKDADFDEHIMFWSR